MARANADKGKLMMEAGGTYYPYEAMTKQSDDTKQYEVTAGRLFSRASNILGIDQSYSVSIDGVVSGCRIIPAISGSDDVVDVLVGTINIAGVEVSCAGATDLAIARGASACIKYSILVSDAGVVSALAGTTFTSLSTTRGADGGPPLVTVGYVEIGQIWYISLTPAAVASTEIHMDPESHREYSIYPGWKYGNPTIDDDQKIELAIALMLNHTGPVSRVLYAQYYNPTFIKLDNVFDFKPPRSTYSGSDQKTYDEVARSSGNESYGDASFNILIDHNGDNILSRAAGDVRWFKFYPDRTKDNYILFCGRISYTDEYPQDNLMKASVTVVTEIPGINKK